MSAYQVKITEGPNSAHDDLKGLSPEGQEEILTVIEIELRPWPRVDDLDEGAMADEWSFHHQLVTDDGWRWRRGITWHNRQLLDAGKDLGRGVEEACECVIVYRVRPVPLMTALGGVLQPRCRFKVWRICPNSVLAPGIVRGFARQAVQ